MAGVAKAGIDWRTIELAWKGGASPAQLAKNHDVTRQAIENRRDRHGWERDEAAAALASTATGQSTTEPQTRRDRRIIANGQRTLANMEIVLDVLMAGGSVRLAAQRIGMSDNGLRNWLQEDQQFAQLAVAAEAEAGIAAVEQVQAAGARGEWKASAYLLERMRATREDFAPVPAGVPHVPAIPVINFVFQDRGTAQRLADYLQPGGAGKVIYQRPDGSQEELEQGRFAACADGADDMAAGLARRMDRAQMQADGSVPPVLHHQPEGDAS